jgi:tetratricopeptide (TPR) repeat protein
MKQPSIFAIAGCCAAVMACALNAPTPGQSIETHDQTSAMPMEIPLPTTLAGWATGARLFDGLGDYHRPVSTKSPEAQRYFDQGMRFLWGFNHDESTRSFARALELDPTCAMCAWGIALTVGPNYNVPMLAEPRAKIAFEATKRAQDLAGSASPVEQALIATLAQRYPNAQPFDPQSATPILKAHADAMRAVARRYPDDLDVQTLYAESMMNVHAWKLWSPDGTPAEGTTEIIDTLESVLKRDPMHMGALHYYVHAVEASPRPESGLAAAARLGSLAPAAGHLVHMPAHILQRVGRYEESAEANRKGAAADMAYLAMTNPIDYYPAMYVSHNYQFLAYSAATEGREAETLDAVRRSRASVSDTQLQEMPGTDWYVAELYTAPVRFGRWDMLLAEAPPAAGSASLTGGYLYATAVALAAKHRPADARTRLAQLDTLIAGLPADMPAGQNTLRDVLAVARRVAAARISSAEGRSEDALRDLRAAVVLEDGLAYDEPAGWFFPVRHLLGAELLRVGRANEAEKTYRDDLARHPGNGWALYGLMQALKAEGRNAEASAAEAQFHTAWRQATISISASAF